MFIELGNIGTGKTTSLIRDAHFTGYPIVVSNQRRKEHIHTQATEMRMNIEVFTVEELKEMGARKPDIILVDELEDVLLQTLGSVVVKATMSRGN